MSLMRRLIRANTSCRYRSSTSTFSCRKPVRYFTNINDVPKAAAEDQREQQRPLEPKVPLAGQFKNPIVQKLWAAREEAKQRVNLTEDVVATTDVAKAAAAVLKEGEKAKSTRSSTGPAKRGKTPKESQTSISYPFSQDEFLLESYKNSWGSVRFGKILEDLDALAGNIAFNHVEGNPLIVTAAVDRIRLRRSPVIERDQILSGKVTWVGSSSMEIMMSCREDNGTATASDDDKKEWLEAYFTFVTLDPESKRPFKMVELEPETEEERTHYELGAIKAKNKKIARKSKIQIGKQLTEESLRVDKLAASLLEEAGPLLNMPSLASPKAILMSQTKMQNALIAQPQVRNLHNRVFGGFLMRRAFELAFSTCYLFGGVKPIFLEVDDVSFELPVDIGDLLVFNSRVLYTLPDGIAELDTYYDKISVPSDTATTSSASTNKTSIEELSMYPDLPRVMVEIECWKTVPETAGAKVSNYFYFSFALPTLKRHDGGKTEKNCRKILPANIDEARRMANRMIADKEETTLRS